jgi:dihydropteroate synthase
MGIGLDYYKVKISSFIMDGCKPKFVVVDTLEDARRIIGDIGSDAKSVDIMAPKAVHRCICLYDVAVQDAIIIKQDMLSVGGEVAIPKDAFYLEKEPVKILVMGTVHQLHLLVEKLSRHYPRIQRISVDIERLLQDIS